MTLEMHGVHKSFGGVAALSNVSMTIGSDEIVGLIGPNGSGKTTLLNTMTGVETADSGHFSLGDTSWRETRPHSVARQGIARTFQNIRLFQEMTVAENVGVAAAAVHGRSWRGPTEDVIELLSLGQWQSRLPDSLPYGLQRRVELGRAIARRPSFLLLDEPAAGLNPEEGVELQSLLLSVHERIQCGVLLIDHNVRLVMETCRRVVVLNEGSVIAEGRPQKVRSDPAVIQAYLG